MSDLKDILFNPLRRKMDEGKMTVGMIVRLVKGVEIVAIAKTAGFDCLFIDLEHNGFSLETVTQICLSSTMAGITPLVRVSGCDAGEIMRALECGALGIIVPNVRTGEQAAAVVAAAKYPPLGNRSIMPNLPHVYFRPVPNKEIMAAMNEATLVTVMIESLAGISAVDEIAAVEGVDMLLIGANDLCNDLGIPGELDHPKLRDAIQRVATACQANGIHFGVGGMGSRPELAKDMIALGARYATAGADVTFLANAAITNAKKFF